MQIVKAKWRWYKELQGTVAYLRQRKNLHIWFWGKTKPHNSVKDWAFSLKGYTQALEASFWKDQDRYTDLDKYKVKKRE